MSVKALVALMMAFAGVDAKVLCPQNHCLQRAYKGSMASSFTCEQYPATGYQCAFEGDPRGCPCTTGNTVRYGNFDQAKANATFPVSHHRAGNTSKATACSNSNLGGDPISGTKVCWCAPTTPAVTTRATAQAKDAEATGYAVPSCMIVKMGFEVQGMDFKTLWGLGTNQAVANMLSVEGIVATFKLSSKASVKWLAFNSSTFVSTMQIDSPDGGAEAALSTLLSNRSDTSALIVTGSKAFVNANAAEFGAAVVGMAQGLLLPFLPATFSAVPSGTSGTSGTTGTTGAATNATGSAEASVSTRAVVSMWLAGLITLVALSQVI